MTYEEYWLKYACHYQWMLWHILPCLASVVCYVKPYIYWNSYCFRGLHTQTHNQRYHKHQRPCHMWTENAIERELWQLDKHWIYTSQTSLKRLLKQWHVSWILKRRTDTAPDSVIRASLSDTLFFFSLLSSVCFPHLHKICVLSLPTPGSRTSSSSVLFLFLLLVFLFLLLLLLPAPWYLPSSNIRICLLFSLPLPLLLSALLFSSLLSPPLSTPLPILSSPRLLPPSSYSHPYCFSH